MEGMDADCYVLEYEIRDRLINARERARVAALLREANGSQRPTAVRTRLMDVGRQLVKGMRKAAGEIVHVLSGLARTAKHSS